MNALRDLAVVVLGCAIWSGMRAFPKRIAQFRDEDLPVYGRVGALMRFVGMYTRADARFDRLLRGGK